MIIGLSHVTVNSVNMEKEISQWTKSGWNLQFYEKNIPSCSTKHSFMESRSILHDMAYLIKVGSPSVEILQYEQPELKRNSVVFDGNSVLFPHPFTSQEELFMKDFGLRKASENFYTNSPLMENWKISLRSEGIDLAFDGQMEPCYLDAIGPSCLAFYTTSLEADVAFFQETYKCNTTKPINIFVNQKELNVQIIRSPMGHFFELIEFRR